MKYTGLLVASGLVETDLPLLAYADDQQVEAACHPVKGGAIVGDILLGHGPVRDVDILREDVDIVQKRRMQTVVAALEIALCGRIILVDGENLDIGEGDLSRPAAACKLLIQGNGRGSGS